VLATGVVSTLAGTLVPGFSDGSGVANDAQFNGPSGVAADGMGNLYVADTNNCTIRKVVLATTAVSTIAGISRNYGSADGTGVAARFAVPSGVAVDGAGNLYVADTGNNTIRRIVLATGVVSTLAGTAGKVGSTDGTGAAARFNVPSGMTIDSAGNLFVADTGNGTIRKVVPATGRVTTIVGLSQQLGIKLGSLPARLNQPTSVAALRTGELIVVDSAESVVLDVR